MSFNQNNILLLDNGAGRIKFGRFHSRSPQNAPEPAPISIPNSTAKIAKQMQVLIGDDIDQIANGSVLQYHRPFDRGYVNNWGLEIDIWSRVFHQVSVNMSQGASLADYSIVITEPPFVPEPWQTETNEVMFEYFGLNSYARRPAAWFSAFNFYVTNPTHSTYPQSSLIVDSGFSFTHVMPFIDLKCCKAECKRINVGGKLLTNYLKEIVSYRQWNMMDEFKLMDQVKEELCYVSLDFIHEFKSSKTLRSQAKDPFGGKLKKYFVLPDYHNIIKGFAKPDNEAVNLQNEQVLAMESERFSVPELLFHPSDIGLNMAGIPEACSQSVQLLGQMERGLCTTNTVLTGGNVQFQQFQQRMESELRPLIPDDCDVNIFKPDQPIEYAWRGMHSYVEHVLRSSSKDQLFISKSQYLEHGSSRCNQKFYNDW